MVLGDSSATRTKNVQKTLDNMLSNTSGSSDHDRTNDGIDDGNSDTGTLTNLISKRDVVKLKSYTRSLRRLDERTSIAHRGCG